MESVEAGKTGLTCRLAKNTTLMSVDCIAINITFIVECPFNYQPKVVLYIRYQIYTIVTMYVSASLQAVKLLVIDEIHLLGDERGPVLEVIVSRTNFISSHTSFPVRVVGLSTALANAQDLSDWLRVKHGLFNFHPAVRPVQLETHIEGFPGKHYCPRMATMNKPIYNSIKTYSPNKPVLVFVSSRRQTRLTAFDLVSYVGAENDPKQWLHIDEQKVRSSQTPVLCKSHDLLFTVLFLASGDFVILLNVIFSSVGCTTSKCSRQQPSVNTGVWYWPPSRWTA